MKLSTGRSSLLLSLCILLTFVLSCTIHIHLYRRYRSNNTFLSPMLYLPSGKYLKKVSFGYHALVADFIYLWSIQYYGDAGFHPRMDYLQHTYDIITELDPQYLDAYQTGALFMFYEGRNPKAGLRLLDKGLERNPAEWILPLDAGFYCMVNLKNKEMAAAYFQKAAAIPEAHSLAKRALASLRFKMGDRAAAMALWQEVFDVAEESRIKQTAYQHLHELKVLIDLDHIREAIQRYVERFGRPPFNLDQLAAPGYLREVPRDPEGNPYVYDARTGQVTYPQQLTLYKKYQ